MDGNANRASQSGLRPAPPGEGARRWPRTRRLKRIAARLQSRGRALQGRLRWLWAQEGSPGERARGLAAGVFTGCLPFFGFQIVLGVALAAALRGNRILAAAGTWISNPLTTLPLCWLNYQLGVALLGPGPAWPGIEQLAAADLRALGWAFSSRLLLGSLLIGVVSALISGVVCWRWLDQRRGAVPVSPARQPPR